MTDRHVSPNRVFISWSTLAVVCFVGLIQAAWWAVGDQYANNGSFVDGDSYTRLLRIERLIETADWFDTSIPDANAPYGTTVHWTRLFDVVMLLVSAPLIPFMGFAKALFWAGIVVSPLLHMLGAATLAWALTPLIGRIAACFAGALSAAQAGVMVFGIVGRADHHMLFPVLIALAFGYLVRVFLNPDPHPQLPIWAGLALSLGIWVGPEFLLFMALCMGLLGVVWLLQPSPHHAALNQRFAYGLACGLVLALFIERGVAGFGTIAYDRISIVHATLAALGLAYWSAVAVLTPGLSRLRLSMRAVLCFGGTMICAAVMIYLFPKIAGNPLNDADQAIQPIYAHIAEYKPIRDGGHLLIYYGGALFALPWLIWRLKSSFHTPGFWMWALIGLCLTVYLWLGINWIRWTLYAGLFLTILIGDLVFQLDQWISRKWDFPKRLLIKVVAILSVATGPLVIGALIVNSAKTDPQRLAENKLACPIKELSAFLNQPPLANLNQTIVASANFGPELMYRTAHKVVATVHHRNVAGILDGHKIYQATDAAVARALIDARRVTLLLLCPGAGSDIYFLTDSPPQALYHRLVQNRGPDWLTPVALPSELADRFRLFAVQNAP
ncbi:MAG: hypothetical protein HQ483_21470 [Rhodospirillales bacterium]|nr:hypothetical protein [Rhodospirillales bacterium]